MWCFAGRTSRVLGMVLRVFAVAAALGAEATLARAQNLTSPVYRFANTRAGTHFYTIYESEKTAVQQNYSWFQYEGVGFYASTIPQPGIQPVYRFANTRAGDHFYTIYESERTAVQQNYSWFQDEGVGFYASMVPQPGMLPVYRFANTQAGGHFYTIYESEKNAVTQNYDWFKYEGIGFYASPVVASTVASDLLFVPDAGFRKESASIPRAGADAFGTVYLYYTDNVTNQNMVATAADGLNFGVSTVANPCCTGHANDSRRTQLPDGTWRFYSFDESLGVMTSSKSTDGILFQQETGIRYTPVAADHGWIGVFDAFTLGSRVILLYLGDKFGLNNLRRAVSTDSGVTFTFDTADVLGDAVLGGGNNSYVDPKTILLPDGRRRLFVMRRGAEIDSFISSDGGLTFTLETGTRLKLSDFTSVTINSLNDPSVVRLADGRYRMYVAGLVTGTNKFSIISATTK